MNQQPLPISYLLTDLSGLSGKLIRSSQWLSGKFNFAIMPNGGVYDWQR